MTDKNDYIDRFYKGELSSDELVAFDKMVREDPQFAEEVAFYGTTYEVINHELAIERKKKFREIYNENDESTIIHRTPVRKLWQTIAAAAVIVTAIIGAYVLFFRSSPSSPRQLADTYLKEQLLTLGVTMGSHPDSVQQAKSLYNEGKYADALQQFESLAGASSLDPDIKQDAGLAALRLEQYDKALKYFTELENYRGLYSNPGKFLHALTLIKRNQSGDMQAAKQLLSEVVEKDLDKKEIAEQWLKQW